MGEATTSTRRAGPTLESQRCTERGGGVGIAQTNQRPLEIERELTITTVQGRARAEKGKENGRKLKSEKTTNVNVRLVLPKLAVQHAHASFLPASPSAKLTEAAPACPGRPAAPRAPPPGPRDWAMSWSSGIFLAAE